MTQQGWKSGWQEGSFQRIREFVGSSPAWFRDLSPSDVVEDAYLLGIASTLFLRDEDSGAAAGPAVTVVGEPPAPTGPLGIPAFPYERCVTPNPEAAGMFDAASAGKFGAFHREAARAAGTLEAWVGALAVLRRAGCLKAEWPAPSRTHLPPLSNFKQDLKTCTDAVFRKALHALKIGFGLWGRWESA